MSIQRRATKLLGFIHVPRMGACASFNRYRRLKSTCPSRNAHGPLRHTVIDLAKMGYKSALEEGVGVLPTLKTSTLSQDYPIAAAKEGWALLAKFRIGQTTGRKLDAEVVAREMRRARGADCLRLFQSSELLTASQSASYFSRLNAGARQQDMNELDIQASEEETNFTGARDVAATASEIQHPIMTCMASSIFAQW